MKTHLTRLLTGGFWLIGIGLMLAAAFIGVLAVAPGNIIGGGLLIADRILAGLIWIGGGMYGIGYVMEIGD